MAPTLQSLALHGFVSQPHFPIFFWHLVSFQHSVMFEFPLTAPLWQSLAWQQESLINFQISAPQGTFEKRATGCFVPPPAPPHRHTHKSPLDISHTCSHGDGVCRCGNGNKYRCPWTFSLWFRRVRSFMCPVCPLCGAFEHPLWGRLQVGAGRGEHLVGTRWMPTI